MAETKESPTFLISGIRPIPNDEGATGELLVDYQLNDEFKTWYKQKHGLKRWSQKHFEKELAEMVKNKMARESGIIDKDKEE